jgi:hypothetical protein
MKSEQPMYIVLYRWRLHAGSESDFKEAWTQVTESLLSRGSLGSRLHLGDDGLWYGYAQWPSEEARRAAFAAGDVDAAAVARTRAAIIEELPEIILLSRVNLLVTN